MRLKPRTGRSACPATAGLCTQHPGTSTSPGWSFPSPTGGPCCSLRGPSRLFTSINSAAPRGSGLVIRFCISEDGWKILLFVVCKMLMVAQDNRPFLKGDLQAKNTGRSDAKGRMRRQRWGCMAGGIWGVSALFMLGGGKSLLPEIMISLREGKAGASSGTTAGRSAWAHRGLGKRSRDSMWDKKRKDGRLASVLTVMPNG